MHDRLRMNPAHLESIQLGSSNQVMLETKSRVGSVSNHDALTTSLFWYPSHVSNMAFSLKPKVPPKTKKNEFRVEPQPFETCMAVPK